MRFLATLLTASVLALGASLATAQTYDISWYKIAGGGGTSTNGAYSLSGTIGQTDAGTMSGGNFTLTGGFWSLIAVQTVGGPTLYLKGSNNTVVLSWSATFTGYVPQQEPSLSVTNWTLINTNTYPITTANGTNTVTLPVSGNEFYRLYHP